MESPSNVFTLNDCHVKLPYICQTSQVPHPDVIERMGIPDYVHPLDNVTDQSKETNVGFSDISVWKTELKRPAIFKGSEKSFIEDINGSNISSKYGLSIGVWIRLQSTSTNNIPILDLGSKFLRFNIYINSNSLIFQICKDITCQNLFTGSSHTLNALHVWTFIGLTFDSQMEISTLYINETFGSVHGDAFHIKFVTNWTRF